MPDWRLVVEPHGRPGAENMAVDEALLHEAGRTGAAFLRLYCWSPPCISFGRHEPALRRYDRDAIRRLGLDTVRRPTGGRAVWHADELTYAVAAPISTFGSLRDSYLHIHKRLAAALRCLGAAAELASPRPPMGLGAGPCFASPVGGEVLVAGRKVVGSAQRREGAAFLQHGSILLDGSQAVLRAVGRPPDGPIDPDAATTLHAVLERPVDFSEVAEAICATWGLGCDTASAVQPDASHTARFADSAWTWRR
jgi:lipoyl(octanoyl) transferase